MLQECIVPHRRHGDPLLVVSGNQAYCAALQAPPQNHRRPSDSRALESHQYIKFRRCSPRCPIEFQSRAKARSVLCLSEVACSRRITLRRPASQGETGFQFPSMEL
jgi:hypothetical protein